MAIIKDSFKSGLGFGLTSGIITTLGLIVGVYFSTGSRLAIISGILTIAIADSFSDALGMHVSLESSKRNRPKDIWISTFSTFVAKLFFASLFVVPFWFLDMCSALIISIIMGIIGLGSYSYFISKVSGQKSFPAIFEHCAIGVLVVVITGIGGELLARLFRAY